MVTPAFSQERLKLVPLMASSGVLAWLSITIPVLVNDKLRCEAPLVWWVAAVLHAVLYLIVIRAAYRPRTRLHLASAAMIPVAMVAVATWPADGLSPVFVVVNLATMGFVFAPRWVVAALVLQCGWMLVWMSRQELGIEWPLVYIAVCCFAALMVEVAVREQRAHDVAIVAIEELERANTELENANASLQRSNDQLARAQQQLAEQSRDEERLRIARDVHDTLGHRLAALALNLEVASHLVAAEPAAPHVQQSRDLAKEVLGDVRSVVARLREPRRTIEESIRRVADRIPEPDVVVEVEPGLDDEPVEVRDAVLEVVGEGLSNAVQHAAASRITISVRRDEGRGIVAEVLDDGQGAAEVIPARGLAGVMQRLGTVGGSVEWHSEPQGGMRLTAVIPKEHS